MSIIQNIPPTNSHFISLSTGAAMTSRYRSSRELILNSNYQDKDILPLSETFNRDTLDALLAREDCAAIRIYFGMDEQDKVHTILVGVTKDNADILPAELLTDGEEDDYIAEIGQRCPVTCPPESDLNN